MYDSMDIMKVYVFKKKEIETSSHITKDGEIKSSCTVISSIHCDPS